MSFRIMLWRKKMEHIKIICKGAGSLKYDIEIEDICNDMKGMNGHFDFSDYPRHHELYSIENI